MKAVKQNLGLLYNSAGGEEGIEKILTAFYQKMSGDIMLGFFFAGKDLAHIVSRQKSFLLRAAGKSPSYSGKVPGKAHQDIPPILKGHFDRRMVLLRQTLEEFELPPECIEVWVDFEEQFRKSIVSEERPVEKGRPR